MRIHKLKHCCLVIDLKAADGKQRRILMDPGFYSVEEHDKLSHVDIVLITHEHTDHFHLESLKALVGRAPDATVITDVGVGAILSKEGIEHRVMEHGNVAEVKDVRIEAYGKEHAILHKSMTLMSNVGFFIGGGVPTGGTPRSLFFPGDAFTDPGKSIDVLALPVAGPWMKLPEAIDYALQVKPRLAFPVHDGLRIPSQHLLPEKILGLNGIEFIKLEEGGIIDI